MRFVDSGHPATDPLGPRRAACQRTVWQQRARKALDSWLGTIESSVAFAIEQGYVDGLKRAAEFVQANGQPELATMVKDLAIETPKA